MAPMGHEDNPVPPREYFPAIDDGVADADEVALLLCVAEGRNAVTVATTVLLAVSVYAVAEGDEEELDVPLPVAKRVILNANAPGTGMTPFNAEYSRHVQPAI